METSANKKKGINPILLIIIIVLVISVPTLVGVFVKKQLTKLAGGIGTPVTCEKAIKGSLKQEVELSGSIDSEETKTYFSPVSGVINKCDINTGDTIKKGDLLAGYDVEDLKQQLNTAELEKKVSMLGSDIAIKTVDVTQQKASEAARNYEEAEAYVAHYNEVVGSIQMKLTEAKKLQTEQAELAAEVEKLNAALLTDPGDKKSAKKLEKKEEKLKEVSKKLKDMDVDALTSAYEINSSDLAEYKALKEQYNATREGDPTARLQKEQQSVSKELAQLSTEGLEEAIAKAEKGVSAEFDGVVIGAVAKEGMAVTEGMELFTVADMTKVKVVVPAGKNDLEKIEKGQRAMIEAGGREYTGEVKDISRIASTNSSGSVSVNVDIHIDNPDDGLILGTEAKVSINTAEKTDVILVPMVCLNYSSDSVFCYVVRDNKLKKVEVETGISDDEMIEVISGISAGDDVVSEVTSDLKEDMDVKAVHNKDEKDKDNKDKEDKDE